MKKATGFIAFAIALTLLFYLLAYYLLPAPPPSAAMVALFAAIALVITWIGQVTLGKFRSRNSGKPGSHGTHLMAPLLLLVALSLVACERARPPSSAPGSESGSSASPSPPPPPPPPPPPASSPGPQESMARVTGTAFLLTGENEQSGYGLYSYVLMSHQPEASEAPRWKACLKALLELPTAAGLAQYVPKSRINITYIPLDSLAPQWNTLSIDRKVDYVMTHYEFARSAATLASLSEKTGSGPVIISLLQPLSLSQHPHPVLVQDLTLAQPTLMATYVSYFVQQAARDQFWQQSALAQFELTLRNGLETAAVGLGMSKDAVQAWVKYFK